MSTPKNADIYTYRSISADGWSALCGGATRSHSGQDP
jgi:hypothetical protein